MGFKKTIKAILHELNAPRYFEARWGCIKWGKVSDSINIPAFIHTK